MEKRKKIYIAHTGGTIGMKPTSNGYQPCAGYLARQMKNLPELANYQMPEYHIHEYDPLIDSSNMSPENWLNIAKNIAKNHEKYDGFVILHGTDTMAYTASALPFMLHGLQKPVILTGSQIPLCEIRSDARENLITAMLISANYNIPEVCLFFGNKLIRGNRSVKVNAVSFDAFDSPNFPSLGKIGVDIKIRWDLVLNPPKSKDPIQINVLRASKVAALRLFPGISKNVVKNILAPPIKGLVLETYGVGNGPASDLELLDVLKKASDQGIVIVNCTQCLSGYVDMSAYATGTALAQAGIVSGLDMTAEAALAKMFYLFSQNFSPKIIRKEMQKNLRGELTPQQYN